MKENSSIRQVHIRVPADLKKALKMFCVREGTTEQAWLLQVINSELAQRASDLWPGTDSTSVKERGTAKHPGSHRELATNSRERKVK